MVISLLSVNPTPTAVHHRGGGTKPLRIALTSYRGNPFSGGQGVYIHYLSRELALLGHEVTVFSGPPYPVVDPSVRLVHVPGLDLLGEPDPFRLPYPWDIGDLAGLGEAGLMLTGAFPDVRAFGWRLSRYLNPDDFDVIHDNQSLVPPLGRWACQGVPVVASIHHPITVDKRIGLQMAHGLLKKVGLRRFYGFIGLQARVARQLDNIATVSEASARDLSREMGIMRDCISVIPVGVDTSVFRRREDVTRELDLVCTTASADVPLKGLRTLVDAISQLPKVRLAVMGQRRPESGLEAHVQAIGLRDRVEFMGNVDLDTMVETYSRASVAVIPSLYEGFSLPAIEAMACGTPLVASRGGALSDVVSDAGVLCAPGSVGELAEALAHTLAHPFEAQERAEYARARCHKMFSWRRTAELSIDQYRQAIEGRPR